MAPTLERCLVDMYSRIIDFAAYIINYFQTNPISEYLSHALLPGQ